MTTAANTSILNTMLIKPVLTFVEDKMPIVNEYSSWAFHVIQSKIFDTFHANGTLLTAGDIFTTVVKKVHEFLADDEGFLGAKYTQFTDYVSANPHTFASRVIVLTASSCLAKWCFTKAWYPEYQKKKPTWRVPPGAWAVPIYLSFPKRIALYSITAGAAVVASYEVFSALAGRVSCNEGFHDCMHSLFSSFAY